MRQLKLKDIVVFENDHYIAINKPAGIAALDDRSSPLNIKDLAKAYWEDAQLCHRLDKETSGALLIAKTPEAYRHASIQFERRKVSKVYHAIGKGLHDLQNQKIDMPLTTLSKGIVRVDFRDGKPSETIVNTLKGYRSYTLLECILLTGRMHQIRVHLSQFGAPIVADSTYGGPDIYLSDLKSKFNLKKGTEERPIISRVALHARELKLTNPDESELHITIPYPKDMAVLIKHLDRYHS